MAGTNTSKRALLKPDVNSTGWGTDMNTNLDLLDRIGDLFNFRRIGATADRWYCAGKLNNAALSTGAPTANVLRAVPFIVPYNTTLDRIAINVTTLTAGNQRLGIFSDDGNCHPGARLLDAGVVTTGTTGVKSITISQAVAAGTLLWLVSVGDAAPTVRSLPVTGAMDILGMDNTLGTAGGIGWSVAYTYAALPATWPGSDAVITADPVPAIFVRASA
jgi:hypothetical protein